MLNPKNNSKKRLNNSLEATNLFCIKNNKKKSGHISEIVVKINNKHKTFSKVLVTQGAQGTLNSLVS